MIPSLLAGILVGALITSGGNPLVAIPLAPTLTLPGQQPRFAPAGQLARRAPVFCDKLPAPAAFPHSPPTLIHIMTKDKKTKTAYSEPTARFETITPERARADLKNAENIRDENKRKIGKYIEAMKKKKWEINGHTIKYYQDGVNFDGQNRLRACDKSNCSFQTFVSYGIKRGDDVNVDVGEKRNFGQYLRGQGVAYHVACSSITSNILSLERYTAGMRDSARTATHDERIACFIHHRKEITFWAAKLANKRLLWPAQIGAVLVVAKRPRGYASAKTEFMEYLKTGADMSATDPVLVLRNLQIEDSKTRVRIPQRTKLALVVLAWNWHRTQTLLPKAELRFIDSGPTEMEFPKVDG